MSLMDMPIGLSVQRMVDAVAVPTTAGFDPAARALLQAD